MADHSKIEWTDATWNPLRGCSRVSEGCRHCYAETVAARFSKSGMAYEGLIHPSTGGWNGQVRLVPELLRQPWDWVKPRRIFVNSMSDLFHEQVPFEFIAAVFWIMSVTTRHTYQVLTKRPARMVAFFEWLKAYDPDDIHEVWDEAFGDWRDQAISDAAETVPELKALDWRPATNRRGGYDNCGPAFPYENVWLGVSVEDQKTADERIPLLLQCPAAVRWLSCEPLLGSINLLALPRPFEFHQSPYGWDQWLAQRLHWVVAGGESGPGARPMHPDWARSLRDQCASNGVPFFFKQWGEWGQYVNEDHFTHCGPERQPHAWVDRISAAHGHCWLVDDDGGWSNYTGEPPMRADGQILDRVAIMGKHGKREAGRLLDGLEHSAFPERRCG